jgi:lysophospholipase L1-like esterase
MNGLGMGMGMGGGGASFTLSSLPGLIGEWRFDQGSGTVVQNDVVNPRPTLANLVRLPEQQFSNAYTKANCTVTEAYTTSPDGDTTATRVVFTAVAAGSAYCRDGAGVQMTAVPSVQSLYVKSNTGLSQTIRLMRNSFGTNSANLTIPASGWTRISDTWTPSAGNFIIGFINDTTGSAADFSVWGHQFEVGTTPTTYVRPAGHLVPFQPNTPPTWTTGGVAMTGDAGTRAFCGLFQNAVSLATGTIHYAVACTASVAEGYDPVFHVGWNNGNKLRAYARDNNHVLVNTVNGTTVSDDSGSAHSNPLNPITPFSAGVHVFSLAWNGSTAILYCDGVPIRTTAFTPTSTTDNVFGMFSNLATRYFTGNGHYAAWYTSAHTGSQIQQAARYIMNVLSVRGLSVGSQTYGMNDLVVWAGDSIMVASAVVGYPAISSPTLTRIPVSINAATIGDQIANGNNAAANVDALYNSSRRNNILFVNFGANDLNVGNADPTTIFAAFKAYGQARRAVGWKVVWSTVLPSTRAGNTGGGGFNAQRATLNTSIRGDTSFYDALADFAADATMGPDAAASNATYYSDGTHVTLAGHQILAPIAATAINSIMA